jgi:polysaccharide export outer membrane protein
MSYMRKLYVFGLSGLSLITLAVLPNKAAAADPKIIRAAKTTDETKGVDVPRQYVIGAGDLLQISVWKEPDASVPNVVVRSDGAISIPLIKEVHAAGLTPRQLEELLTERFKRVIREVDVTVLVKEIHSEKVYMLGAVKKEGPISMTAPMTVLQAIAEAGGLTDYARRSKVYVLRNESRQQIKIPCDYEAAMKGNPHYNIQLEPGDTVVVP